MEAITPEFCPPGRRCPQLPVLPFCVIRHDDRIVGNLLGDEFHPWVFECLTKHWVAGGR